MASSTHHLSNLYSATSAPPPTPSAQPASSNHSSSSAAAAADTLSRLLHPLPPPTLSLPTRRSSPPTSPPLISLLASNSGEILFSFSSQFGFFQLSDHRISSELAYSAVSDSLSVSDLTRNQKDSYFPKKWPLGYKNDDDDGRDGETFWWDSACSTVESADVDLASLKSLTRELERVGLEVIEKLLNARFKNPGKEDPTRFCSLMWVHREGLTEGDKTGTSSGGFYPYVVCLEYQIRRRKYSLLSYSGWVTVLPPVDSVMVTVGDIAQLWSNGKLKRVRGKPLACMEDVDDQPRNICMSVLVTLPLESAVTPLLPAAIDSCSANEINNELEEEKEEEQEKNQEEERLFSSFSFQDYAWRVYHEPFLSKDPLDRYRIYSFHSFKKSIN